MHVVVPDLYLPTNGQALLSAFASALKAEHPAEIIYLDDAAPLPIYVMKSLRETFPYISFSVHSDRDAIDQFSRLPKYVPSTLRRNISVENGRVIFPVDRPPSWLGQKYRTAYIYLSTNFVSKTLRRRCQTIILREEGLANYYTLRFGTAHAILRLLSGRSPWSQVMGEEKWIDEIEVNSPERLPSRLRHKGRKLELATLLEGLPESQAKKLVKSFWKGQEVPSPVGAALILTQPIDQVGFCTETEKLAIYGIIAASLGQAGYRVVIKNHPRELGRVKYDIDCAYLPSFFPIEAWPWLTGQKFDVAVALCTSALDISGKMFSRQQVQLVDPKPFGRRNLDGWRGRLNRFLSNIPLRAQG